LIKKRRKPRSDCNYIIYEMVDNNGNSYIGLTRKTQSTALKSVKIRWQKHLSRAKNQCPEWTLYRHLKKGAIYHAWSHNIIAVVRGRKDAYALERNLIIEHKPNLNDQYIKEIKLA